MQVTSSYGAEIRKQNIPILHTLRIYRSAVSYLIRVYAEAWEELSGITDTKKRFNEAEHLVHTTVRFCPVFPKASVLSETFRDPACIGEHSFL